MKKKLILGIDLGGTKIMTVLLDGHFRVLARSKHRMEAHKGEKRFLKVVHDSVEEVLESAKCKLKHVRCVGVGCAGMIDFDKGIVKLSPNIQFLKNYPLRKKLGQSLKTHVIIENDVNAGLYGEHQLGAARGFKHVVGIFPGTGVGGGLILNDALYRGANGAAGEVGHMFMKLDGMIYGGNDQGTLEAMIGRTTIAAEVARLSYKQQAPVLYDLAGTDVRKIKSKVLKRSSESDKAVRDLIEFKAKILGMGMANLVNILNPELIVLGGGLIESMGSLVVPIARDTMKTYAMPPNLIGVRVKTATLKDDAVAVGAAKLAFDTVYGGRS